MILALINQYYRKLYIKTAFRISFGRIDLLTILQKHLNCLWDHNDAAISLMKEFDKHEYRTGAGRKKDVVSRESVLILFTRKTVILFILSSSEMRHE